MKQIDPTNVFTVIEHTKSLAILNSTSGKSEGRWRLNTSPEGLWSADEVFRMVLLAYG